MPSIHQTKDYAPFSKAVLFSHGTDRHTDWKVKTKDTLSSHQEFFLQRMVQYINIANLVKVLKISNTLHSCVIVENIT